MTSVMDERARITELVSPNTAHSSLDYGLNVNCPPCRKELNAILGPRWFCHCACGWTKGPTKLYPRNGFTRLTSVRSVAGWAGCARSFFRGRPSHYNEDSKKSLSVSSGASILRPMNITLEWKRLTTEEAFGLWDFRYLTTPKTR